MKIALCLLVEHLFTGCQQAGTVASRQIITGATNARMNATVVPNPVQGSIVMRPTQSTVVVGPTTANAVQPPMSIVGGKLVMPTSAAVGQAPRTVVPANASVVAGM